MTGLEHSGGLSRAARWLAGRTLRGRLIAGLLCLLALACAIVGVVTYTHLHSVLISQLNAEVIEANGRYTACLSGQPPGPGGPGSTGSTGSTGGPPQGTGHPPAYCSQQQQTAAFTAMIHSNGRVSYPYLAADNGPATCRLTVVERAAIARVPIGGVTTVELTGYGTYQMTAGRTADGTIVVNGLLLRPVTDTLQQVAVAEIAVFLAALLVTGVMGTAWVRISLRPLRQVAATATRVTELPLSSGEVSLPERVRDANPATEVGQVGAAFNRMLGHVESALARREASENRLRSFAADASHELRTPLAAIRGYAELARRRAGSALPDEVAHALSRVEAESARMAVLVDELLLLARLDAGRPLASEPVDMTRLVIDVTTDARVASADHRWQLELPVEPVLIRGDEQRLHQVLDNVVSNAARHTPAGTVVTVTLGTAPDPTGSRTPDTAVISVTDNGPGIPAELQPAVFERFVRGDSSRSRSAGSSGLGLAIVQAVTVAHGGSVDVTSRPGETRFTIRLPMRPDPHESASPA